MPTAKVIAVEAEAGNDTRTTRMLDAALLYGLCAVLLFGPLAFGAVEPWSIFVLECGAAALFVLWVARQAVAGAIVLPANPALLPMIAFALVLVAQVALRWSAFPYLTWHAGLKYVAYGVLALVAAHCFTGRRSLRRFALVMVIFGFLLAVFAVAQHLTSNGSLYWVRRPRAGSIFGPYVNRNHYAGLMEMLGALALGLSLAEVLRGGKRWLAGFAAVAIAGSVLVSGSRAGMLVLVLELAVFAVLAFEREGSRRAWLAFAAFSLALLAFFMWLDSGRASQRFATLRDPLSQEVSGRRIDILKDSVAMVRERPLLGWGAGVFPHAYPRFQSYYTSAFINAAHNDFVQTLVETGAPGFAAAMTLVVLVLRAGLRRRREWRHDRSAAVAVAACVGCCGLLVHGVFDFNLQIPANTAIFVVFCTAACSTARERGRSMAVVHRAWERPMAATRAGETE